MYKVAKFSNLPQHQALLGKVAKILCEDTRVLGLYVYGSPMADEYSDIDIKIFFSSDEQRDSFRNDIETIIQRIGKVKVGTIYDRSEYMYLAVFDPEEIKVDISLTIIYKDGNPFEYPADILYDPEGHLEKMISEAPKFKVDFDDVNLERRTKMFYVGLNYVITKIERGELWKVFHVLDVYRKAMIQDEDILAHRLQLDYLDVEKNLDEERIAVLNKTLIAELTVENAFLAMDAIFEYWDRFLVEKIRNLGLFPEEYAKNMTEYYERKKREILRK